MRQKNRTTYSSGGSRVSGKEGAGAASDRSPRGDGVWGGVSPSPRGWGGAGKVLEKFRNFVFEIAHFSVF